MSIATSHQKKEKDSYKTIWRWHFYAGILFAPLLILLSITGIIYLFKPQIENVLYKDLYFIKAAQTRLSATAQLEAVQANYPQAKVTRFTPPVDREHTTVVRIETKKGTEDLFVNPYTGSIVGSQNPEETLMNQIVRLHGELMIGTTGDRLIELAACWAIILLVTGLYLWWPRHFSNIWGTVLPRFSKGKRILLRDLHAVPAFWFSLFISLFILTGLPWSGLWGDLINRIATETHTGYPTGLWDDVPKSVVPSKAVADVPWAAEKLPVPKSDVITNAQLSIEQIMDIAKANKVAKGYTITLPKGETGVYTIAVSPPRPEEQATLHIDQYSGIVLADLRFADYGMLAKAISIGVALHEGHYFGLANQLLDLLICLALIGIVITGIFMWLKRKKRGSFGAPPKGSALSKGWFLLLIVLSILFPLVGASLVVVWLFDTLLVKRIALLRKWLY